MASPEKKGKEEKEWEWYPQNIPGEGKGHKGQKKKETDKGPSPSKGRGKGNKGKGRRQESEDEEDERYGHILKHGIRVPWDLLLDREIKMDVEAKPPPPKLSTVRHQKPGKVFLTQKELGNIKKKMYEEDEEKVQYEEDVYRLRFEEMGG